MRCNTCIDRTGERTRIIEHGGVKLHSDVIDSLAISRTDQDNLRRYILVADGLEALSKKGGPLTKRGNHEEYPRCIAGTHVAAG